MEALFKELLLMPYNAWYEVVSTLTTEEQHELSRLADSHATTAMMLAAFVSRPPIVRDRAIKARDRMQTKARKLIGYTYP